MTAKEYLSQVKNLNDSVNNKIIDLQKLRDNVLSIKSTSYGDRVQNNNNNDSLSNTVAKIIDMQEDINKDIDNLIDLKCKIGNEIATLNNPLHITLLHKRYIHLSKWEQIAVDMNYDIRQIYRIHGRALQEFNKDVIQCQ